ncbi:hypothetical protein [Cryptosporangium sp. NPDC048952]|uniref:hypothetical protein n=1 Tax=Cryptosporangium sp. NPDC048952 TaxID=3363961 RepID=UPI00372167F4
MSTEPIDQASAQAALEVVRTQQKAVISASMVPDGFWATIAALTVLYAATVESSVPALLVIGVIVFVLGNAVAVLWVVFRTGIRQRKGSLGAVHVASIVVLVLSVNAIGAAIAIVLDRADVPYGTTIAVGIAGVVMAVTGPILSRRLRDAAFRRVNR